MNTVYSGPAPLSENLKLASAVGHVFSSVDQYGQLRFDFTLYENDPQVKEILTRSLLGVRTCVQAVAESTRDGSDIVFDKQLPMWATLARALLLGGTATDKLQTQPLKDALKFLSETE